VSSVPVVPLKLSKKVLFYLLFNALDKYLFLDFVFPLLPKWFTKALRDHTRQESSVDEPLPFVPAASQNALTHDHALLESLMASVFEERFIHVKPTGNRQFSHYAVEFANLTVICSTGILYVLLQAECHWACHPISYAPTSPVTTAA